MKNNILEDDMMKSLHDLVSIPSISGDAEKDYPFGQNTYDALSYCLKLCEKFGFDTHYCDKYMGYAEIGEGKTLMGILVHVDVVPPGTGWTVEPFDTTVIGDKVYGRGVVDDKGPLIAVIYAMKDIKDSGILLNKRIRLIIGCSEESGEWTDIEYYKEHEELPDYGFTADSDFPVVYAEKGIMQLEIIMDKVKSGLISGEGGTAPNMVPSECRINYIDINGEEKEAHEFGKSAHGSVPWEGVNAIGLCMNKIKCYYADFYNSIIGDTFDGSLLDCNFHDEQSEGTSVNPGMLKVDSDSVSLILDIRYPVTFTSDKILKHINDRISEFDVKINVICDDKPMFMDKESGFVQNLVSVYQEITSDMTPPKVMGGGTYAKAMKNIVAFGPDFPNKECTEHQPDEYYIIDDLYLIRNIYRLAIERC